MVHYNTKTIIDVGSSSVIGVLIYLMKYPVKYFNNNLLLIIDWVNDTSYKTVTIPFNSHPLLMTLFQHTIIFLVFPSISLISDTDLKYIFTISHH